MKIITSISLHQKFHSSIFVKFNKGVRIQSVINYILEDHLATSIFAISSIFSIKPSVDFHASLYDSE
ncbi:hypothetical protein BpHYR1_039847 [Brachionus plicatilis]|uniref:Uncharacterized protein n=1 Tax=Brachionus plicatilis TaxID=10195 RepID=A0A3M7S9D4_BRAPC|nr:hypothetical protein BpHYR1_039847 [Brachionus plicatilis]